MSVKYEIQSDYTVPEFLGSDSFDPIARGIADITLRYNVEHQAVDIGQEWGRLQEIQNAFRAEVTTDYSPEFGPWTASEKGNCYTHSLRLAETYIRSGYEAGVVFCNDHTFVLVRSNSPESDCIYMLNPDSRRLSLGDVAGHRTNYRLFRDEVNNQISQRGFRERIITTVFMNDLRARSDVDGDPRSHIKPQYIHPWLNDDYPAAVIMSVDEAKRSLFYYECFTSLLGVQTSNTQKHVAELKKVLGLLKDHNPQMETRERVNSSLKSFKKQIRLWAQSGIGPDELGGVIDAYVDTMPDTFSRDIFTGDVCRTAAKHLGKGDRSSLFLKSIKSYQSAGQKVRKRPKASKGAYDVVGNKIVKCRTEAERLGVSIPRDITS